MLTGCVASGTTKVQPVNLPPPPACMAPVALPAVNVGDDARLALAKHRAALASANGNLSCSLKWYEKVRVGYSKGK